MPPFLVAIFLTIENAPLPQSPKILYLLPPSHSLRDCSSGRRLASSGVVTRLALGVGGSGIGARSMIRCSTCCEARQLGGRNDQL